MPTILRIGPYRFYFYANEKGEPPHIHVDFEDNDVKFWLFPVSLAVNKGVPSHRLKEIEKLVRANIELLREKYHEYHSR